MSPPLAQLRFGPVAIDFPVVLAALAGYSDWPMRVIATRLGAPYTIGEVMLDRFVVDVSTGDKAGRYIRPIDERPSGAQLMGTDPEQFVTAARTMIDAGFNVIDLNFACPVKKVLGKRRGGYLLKEPTTALEIVARVRDSLPAEIPVTVKMRRGIDDSEESRERFFEIFDGSFDRGAAAICVHGRTVKQRYDGESSWDFLRELKQHAGERVVLGSGDLFTAEACLRMIAETGVDAVTAARGAIGNPWIFQQARDLAAGQPATQPSISEQREVLLEHFRLAEEVYGQERCCRMLRKHGIKYAKLHPEEQAVRDAFVEVKNAAGWQRVLEKWYAG